MYWLDFGNTDSGPFQCQTWRAWEFYLTRSGGGETRPLTPSQELRSRALAILLLLGIQFNKM